MRPRRQQHSARQVDHHHHLQRIPHGQQLLLAQGIEHPDRSRQQDRQHAGGVGAKGRQQLFQALVEEQPEADDQHHQAHALPDAETLLEHKHAGDHQEDRAHLHHQLRGAGAEQFQAHQVQHVVAHQAAHRHRHQPAAPGAEYLTTGQAPGRGEVHEQATAGHHQAKPGDRDRVHHLQHLLELDRQNAPEQRGQQGQEKTVDPAAGRDVHECPRKCQRWRSGHSRGKWTNWDMALLTCWRGHAPSNI